MNLNQILQWSAALSGCDAVPADSQVYVESPGDVRRVLFGVDIGIGEILFAKEAGFDAVIAHHPLGDMARRNFAQVVERQIRQMIAAGVDEATARRSLRERLDRIHRADHMANINHLVDTARLVGMPLANVHLACDIIGRQAIVDLLQRRATPESEVGEAVSWFSAFPEYELGHARPEIWLGNPQQKLGRYVVAMAGGTNGGYPVFSEYYRVGVNTVLAMHIAEDDLQKLRAEFREEAALIITGHMTTDSIGINRVIAGLEAQGVEVTRTSGIVAA